MKDLSLLHNHRAFPRLGLLQSIFYPFKHLMFNLIGEYIKIGEKPGFVNRLVDPLSLSTVPTLPAR